MSTSVPVNRRGELIIPAPTGAKPDRDFILLDRSSSMWDKWDDSLVAIDNYVAKLGSGHVNTQITLAIFGGSELAEIHREATPRDWITLRDSPPGHPQGGTPLYDAINNMGRLLRDWDPPKASILIVTDGEEASSHYTTLDQAKAILDWMRAKGWQVTIIGCDFDNAKMAKLLGAADANSLGVAKGHLTDMTTALAAKRKRYQASGDDMDFSDDERQKFGGYLGHSK